MNLNVNGKGPGPYEKKLAYGRSPVMLIHDIARMITERLEEREKTEIVLQKSSKKILIELARKEGRTQLEIVQATHLKAPTISIALQKLEKDGYVSRAPDKYDLRATRVSLTPLGRELVEKLRSKVEEEEMKAICTLTASECETLTRLLAKVKANLVNYEEEDELRF